MEAYEVSPLVNSAANDGLEVTEAVSLTPSPIWGRSSPPDSRAIAK